jgi:hypothetical protein
MLSRITCATNPSEFSKTQPAILAHLGGDGGISALLFENVRDAMGRTIIRKTNNARRPFLLPGGEGQDEGEPYNKRQPAILPLLGGEGRGEVERPHCAMPGQAFPASGEPTLATYDVAARTRHHGQFRGICPVGWIRLESAWIQPFPHRARPPGHHSKAHHPSPLLRIGIRLMAQCSHEQLAQQTRPRFPKHSRPFSLTSEETEEYRPSFLRMCATGWAEPSSAKPTMLDGPSFSQGEKVRMRASLTTRDSPQFSLSSEERAGVKSSVSPAPYPDKHFLLPGSARAPRAAGRALAARTRRPRPPEES